MSLELFFIGCFILGLFALSIVCYEAYKGRDWKMCSLFMIIGWLIAVCQLASGLK